MDVAERLKEAMRLRGMRQVDLVSRTGIGKSSISTYLNGGYIPKQANIYKLAHALGVNPAWLMGADSAMEPIINTDILPIVKTRIPLLGEIAAGQPIFANEEFESYVPAGDDLKCDFALRVTGNSMEPRFFEGDTVFFRTQDDVDDGQIAAVIVDDSATLKHVYHLKNGVQLTSDNPSYPPMIFDSSNSNSVRILGLAVSYMRRL